MLDRIKLIDSAKELGVDFNLLHKTYCVKMSKIGMPLNKKANKLELTMPIALHHRIKESIFDVFGSMTDYEVIFDNKRNKIDYRLIKLPVLYFLFNNDELVYIGQTIDIVGRLAAHNLSDKVFNSFYAERVNLKDMNFKEMAYINKYTPKYNKQIYSTNSLIRRILDSTDYDLFF